MLPSVKMDTDMFQELIEEYRSMISGIYPEWTDYNYHDPGMTFIELFAWLRENQQFHMEQLGVSHYEQFFRLLGFRRKERKAARILAGPRLSFAGTIPQGSLFTAGGMPFETEEEETLCGDILKKIVHLDPQKNHRESADAHQLSCMGDMYFSPFGQEPGPGESCLFLFSDALKEKTAYHIFFQTTKELARLRNRLSEEDVFCPLASLSWTYYSEGVWKPVILAYDQTKDLLFSGRICFSFEGQMSRLLEEGGLYAIRAELVECGYDFPPVLSAVSMNQIVLVQKETWRQGAEEEPFVLAEGTGFPDQEYVLPWKEPMGVSVKIEAEDVLRPGHFSLWNRVEDMSDCGPEDTCYTVDEDEGKICFGNGYYGMPPEGRIRLISMEQTRGDRGNIKPGTLVEWKEGNHTEFEAYLELSRGCGRETMEEALFRLATEKARPMRAVTPEDYEALVKATPGLILYSCKALDAGQGQNQVTMVVRPGDGKRNVPLTDSCRLNILRNLDKRRLIGTQIRLLSPEYIEIRVYLEVSAMPQYRYARDMITDAVTEWFGRIGTSFGVPISYGTLYGMIDSMPCVKRLRVLNLEARNAGVERNQGGDLIPPAGGVFLLKQIEYTSIND